MEIGEAGVAAMRLQSTVAIILMLQKGALKGWGLGVGLLCARAWGMRGVSGGSGGGGGGG